MAHAVTLTYRVYDLPWSADAEQDGKFRRQLLISVVAALSFLPVR